ncbi:PRA1 family protein B4 [Hordeum vulgare]|nr:PRA1 family protein B4 [Hordeum vulgare]
MLAISPSLLLVSLAYEHDEEVDSVWEQIGTKSRENQEWGGKIAVIVGALLIARTIAVILPLWLSTSLAARQGPVPMAGYEISLQVWLTISLLNDALALAGQALLASEYAKWNYKQARLVLYRVLHIGGVTGLALSATLFLGFGYLTLLFTDDPAVLDIAQSGVWPINAIAFVFDGLYYGVSNFGYATYSTVLFLSRYSCYRL